MKIVNEYTPFYLKFPFFQVVYLLLWIPLGLIISFICSILLVKFFSFTMISIIHLFMPFSINLFVMSGRMQIIELFYIVFVFIVYDIILLVCSLEYIISIINKKN